MSANTVRGEHARAFVKTFNGICQWNNPWDRWNDMVNLFAISIANRFDTHLTEEREETYRRIANKYKPEEFKGFPELFLQLVMALETNPWQDFLGQMYMELEMGSKGHGQCFTPFNVCRAMANMSIQESLVREQIDKKGWISCNDCACGAGATLIAAAERFRDLGINYQENVLFVAQDLDMTVAMMCYIQLSLLGCPGYVHIGNTLTEPMAGDTLIGGSDGNTWYTPMYYSATWCGRVIARRLDQFLSRIPERKEAEPSEPEQKEAKPGGSGIQLSIFD